MGYQDEWLLLEAEDELDEVEHRPPTEEFLFYQSVTKGDIDAVKKNCAQERFLDSEGVGMTPKKYRDTYHTIQWDMETETAKTTHKQNT